MAGRLLAAEHVPAGFEMVLDNKEVRTWNLWWNVQLTDDPAAWDDAIRRINAMQSALDGLTADHRLIRAQMAEWCRKHPLFPDSIETLCRQIGAETFDEPVRMGCEGRNLLDLLGQRDFEDATGSSDALRQRQIHALEHWLVGEPDLETGVSARVQVYLGQATPQKSLAVGDLLQALEDETMSREAWHGVLCQRVTAVAPDLLGGRPPRPFYCLQCEGANWEGAQGNCACADELALSCGLLAVGVGAGDGALREPEQRLTQEQILAYARALNAWLSGESLNGESWPDEARYITAGLAGEIAGRVVDLLGAHNPAKEWLAACLLKTVASNQRWRKGHELLDDYPEAVSWLHAG